MKNKFPSVRTLNEQKRIKETWNRWGGSDRKFSFGPELAKRVRLRVCSCSKRSFGFARLKNPTGPELRHHSVGACCVRGRGIFDFSYRPVLKHGPRSLTYMRLCWCYLNHTWAMKVSGANRKMQHRPVVILWRSVLAVSISVRTRKMVNYAWVGWSQGKLLWKPEAVLTCKSFVKLECRGERLIEPSSSWFPPKFLSG